MFWQRKPKESKAPDGHADEAATALEPIRIFLSGEILDAWTPVDDGRLSDRLNADDALPVSRSSTADSANGWEEIDRDRMVMVVAPPHTSNRQLRVKRQRHPIRARTANYIIRGFVHLIPGNGLDGTVLRTRQHFVPVTQASVEGPALPAVEEHEVVLLNVADLGIGLKVDFVE